MAKRAHLAYEGLKSVATMCGRPVSILMWVVKPSEWNKPVLVGKKCRDCDKALRRETKTLAAPTGGAS